jgi:hypothetical protein
MFRSKWFFRIFSLLVCLFYIDLARPANLDGAWASDASVCNKMFVKRNAQVSFAKSSDIYGSGFIFNGDKISGKMASCNIKSRKQDGAILNLIATCSTDIAILSLTQFSLRLDDQGKITRLFPGMPEMETTYYRCP